MDFTQLGNYGIDYKNGLARCMNDEEFYTMMLTLFMQDDSFERLKAARAQRNMKSMFENAHELKGVSGNANMTELYAAVCPLVEALRGTDASAESVDSMYEAVEKAYRKAYEGVSQAFANV